MKKIYVALVGGQPAPVYHGIEATSPDTVVYIYSNETKSVVEKLRECVTRTEDVQKPLDSTDPLAIQKRADDLCRKYSQEELILNISGGLKSWAHLFGRTFEKNSNATVIYIDQNNVLWNYRTMKGTTNFSFDVFALFKLYGNPIENNYMDFNDYTEKDDEVCRKLAEFRKSISVMEFNNLLSVLDKSKEDQVKNRTRGKFETEQGSIVEWERADEGNDACVRVVLCKKDRRKEVTLKSPHAIELAFNSHWFEYLVAKTLNGWSSSKSVFMNCHFPFVKGVDKNEVDIIVNAGNKLLFVECKTQITHITDIDKFNSVVDAYGGTGSKALFVTEAPMKEISKQKCSQYGMMCFSFGEPHFGMSDESALYFLLENEMFNINAK